VVEDDKLGMSISHFKSGYLPLEIFEAIQNFLLSTPSLLNSIPLEDMVGQEPQVNIPGVVDEYPCWRHKIPVDVEDVLRAAQI